MKHEFLTTIFSLGLANFTPTLPLRPLPITVVFATVLEHHRLSLNVTKTKAMAILKKQKEKLLYENSKELFLSIQEERIDNVQFTKYLGVQVDNNLNWKGHIKARSIKISRVFGFLKHAKNFLTQGTLKTLYSGIVEPHFRYCS